MAAWGCTPTKPKRASHAHWPPRAASPCLGPSSAFNWATLVARLRRRSPGAAAKHSARTRIHGRPCQRPRCRSVMAGTCPWHLIAQAWTAFATRSFRRRNAQYASAWTRSNCTVRTATCCISSFRLSAIDAMTSTAAHSRTACAFRSKSRARYVPSSPPAWRWACASPVRTGTRAAAPWRTRLPTPRRSSRSGWISSACRAAASDRM